MAGDQIWFIPVTGGGPFSVTPSGTGPLVRPEEMNVQYSFNYYPTTQPNITPRAPNFAVETQTAFTRATGPTALSPGRLDNCFARFIWDSCACDPEHEDEITLGGQLNVGTVFSKFLPHSTNDLTWDVVDVWAKIRISDLTLVSGVFMSISDVLGNRDSSSDLIGTLSSNVWGIVRMESTTNWSGWEETNLRATVSVLGTTNVANIGRVSVDLEWFAFRLHDGSHD